jgi:hypothetical protein
MIVAIYFGELIFAIALAIMLLAASTLESSAAILLVCSVAALWRGPWPNTSLTALCCMLSRRYFRSLSRAAVGLPSCYLRDVAGHDCKNSRLPDPIPTGHSTRTIF